MIFVPLGKTDNIGASCYYVDIAGTGLALDAGTDPRRSGPASLPHFELVHEQPEWYIDHALITHAHRDHLGAVPLLVDEFPHVHVHMTAATHQLSQLLLPASARLQQRRYEEGSSDHEPLFTEEEAERQSALHLTHELETPFTLTGPHGSAPVRAQFFDAGHILGSTGVLLEAERDDGRPLRLFYTSDTNQAPQTLLPGAHYPEPPVDVLVLETTLGADQEAAQTTRAKEEEQFAEALVRTIAQGGTALVPVFAMGRAQEMLALIDEIKQRGDLPADVPVYTAGIMRAISEIYDRTRHTTPRQNPAFRIYGVEQERVPHDLKAKREIVAEPSIHVVTSGMMFEPTLSNRMARLLVEDEKNAILLVGYAKEDTPAARLMDAAEQDTDVVLHEDQGPQPVRCDVRRFLFSGHSHRRQLLQLVERLDPKTVLLVHGEPEARQWMAEHIRTRHPEMDLHLPAFGEPISLDG